MAEEKIVLNEDLKELTSSGYEIADGEPDIRNWKVKTDDKLDVGKVKELLWDMRDSKVRYMVTDVDGKPLNLVSRTVLIPIGLADLNENKEIVYVPDVTVGHLAQLPEYKKGKVSFLTEREIRKTFLPDDPDRLDNIRGRLMTDEERNSFYDNDIYRDRRFVHRRDRDVDDDGIDDRLERKDKKVDRDVDGIDDRYEARDRKMDLDNDGIDDRREIKNRSRDLDNDGIDDRREVPGRKPDVDNDGVDDRREIKNRARDLDGDGVDDREEVREDVRRGVNQKGGFAPFEEGVIEIREHKEVPVVNKEARVVEEITVNKDVDERTEHVKDSVRRSKVDVEKMRGEDLDD